MTKPKIPERLKPAEFEKKWQDIWEKKRVYSPEMKSAKRPYYNLMMFPYPSAEGLHVGNMYAFTGADVHGRFMRMRGFDVFEPIGLDGFGIHSENYALKVNRHPKEQAKISEKNFYRQMRAIGNSFDWQRTVETYDPDYYRWTQWLFVQMFKHGLAYRAKAAVNWCPSCKTVLADEQVIKKASSVERLASSQEQDENIDVCERCSTPVEKRELEQWFFKITAYAERLLNNTLKPEFNWPEKIKIGQRNWIGKKEGINIKYEVVDVIPGLTRDPSSMDSRLRGNNKQSSSRPARTINYIECFTTRPDTNFGATFIVISPEHSLVNKITTSEQKSTVDKYIKISTSKSKEERMAEGTKKTGVFTGSYAINNLNGEKMPVWVSDFVLMDVGTGAVIGVPGHDVRDFEFAKAMKIPIKRVVVRSDGDTSEITRIEQVQEKEGKMVNSGFLNGLDIHEATKRVMDYFEEKGWGKRVTSYHLRDWLISRQRYWGAPIPMIYCEKCDWQPVPEKDLPVLLPDVKEWRPTGMGRGPLAAVPEFYETKCPNCGGDAKRETDVCDTFLDSAWYYLRYPSVNTRVQLGNSPQPPLSQRGGVHGIPPLYERGGQEGFLLPWDPEITWCWMPVDSYIGGAEHTVLHLLYTRFTWMALRDWGYLQIKTQNSKLKTQNDNAKLKNENSLEIGNLKLEISYDPDEPFKRFYAHGLIIKDGAKMSKSKGNVVVPDEYIKLYGADTLRTYLMFLGPYDGGGDFRDTGIAGMYRWLSRVWRLCQAHSQQLTANSSKEGLKRLHKTIKGVSQDLEKLHYNTAIAKMMEFTNWWMERPEQLDKASVITFLKLLAPFAPYMTEELFQEIKNTESRGLGSPSLGKRGLGGVPSHDSAFTIHDSIHVQPWPKYDETLVKEEIVTMVVQINGKTRDSVQIDSQTENNEEAVKQLVLQSAKVQKWLEGKKIKKTIFVKGRIINFVI